MNFNHLKTFSAVVRFNSFSKAADYLYLSQPTVSSYVRQLEDELGIVLLERSTKSVKVTRAGKELYEYAKNILRLKDRMVENCSRIDSAIVHIGASSVPSAYILPSFIKTYAEKHPDFKFDVHSSDSRGIMNGMLDSVYDIGIVGMKGNERTLSYTKLCSDNMVVITPNTAEFIKLKEQETLNTAELLNHSFILREKGSGSLNAAVKLLKKYGVGGDKIDIAGRIDDQEAIKTLVAGGLGISVISELAVKNEVESKKILMFKLRKDDSVRDFYLITHKNKTLLPHVKEFITELKKNIKTLY